MNSTTSAAEAQLRALLEAVQDYRMVTLAAAGALTWVAYDFCLTFSQEISCIWRTKWTTPNGLLLFIRYYTLFTLSINIAVNTSTSIPFSFCKNWFWYIGFNGPLLSTSLGNALLLWRVNALYGWNRKVIALTSFLWLAETATAIGTIIFEVGSIDVLPRPPGYPLPGCRATSPGNIKVSLGSWSVSLAVSSLYFVITLRQFLNTVRFLSSDDRWDITLVKQIAPTIYLFVRDGAFYFFLAFMVQLLNMVFIVVLADRPIQQMGTAWIMATFAVLSSRIMFNLRTSRGGTSLETDYSMSGNTFAFAQGQDSETYTMTSTAHR